MRGVLITIEGVEGSGKSTHCRRLGERLRARGLEVVLTSEPDGTALGAAIRALFETDGPPPTPLTQTFLFMAARQQHVNQVIRPALARGAVVISDRYADATVAYQGYGRGVDPDLIRELNLRATGGILPDLTLLIDVPVELGLGRIKHRGPHDRLEGEERAFHERVRDGYHTLARQEPQRWQIVDGTRPEAQLTAEIIGAVEKRLGVRADGLR